MNNNEKLRIALVVGFIIGMIAMVIIIVYCASKIEAHSPELYELKAIELELDEEAPHETLVIEEILEEEETEKVNHITDDELMARVVMAEAEGEEMIGKVAVAMTILNRCDYYGLTVETVVFEELNGVKQYSISDNYNDECMRAVEIAQENRELFPSTMMWFKTDGYHDFKNGNPQDYLPIGKHYFSYLEVKNEKSND